MTALRAASNRPLLGLLLGSALVGACTTRTTVHGTYPEVWERTQTAVQSIRFKAANTAARHQRVEKDEAAGTLKLVWTDGDFNDARVLTLRIDPAGGGAQGDADIDRMVTIEAWSWAFFGFIPAGDGSTAELVRLALEKEFHGGP